MRKQEKTAFFKEAKGIYRLRLPFEDLYTSVFLVKDTCPILIDSGTDESDARERIAPALHRMGISEKDELLLLLTHGHSDHGGGAETLMALFPHMRLLRPTDGARVGRLRVIGMRGHAADAVGYYDHFTKSLISGDGVQFDGVGRYGCSVKDADAYLATLAHVSRLSPTRLLPSHEYVGASARIYGKKEVQRALHTARACFHRIECFLALPQVTSLGADEAAEAYHHTHPDLPPIGAHTVLTIRNKKQGRNTHEQ